MKGLSAEVKREPRAAYVKGMLCFNWKDNWNNETSLLCGKYLLAIVAEDLNDIAEYSYEEPMQYCTYETHFAKYSEMFLFSLTRNRKPYLAVILVPVGL